MPKFLKYIKQSLKCVAAISTIISGIFAILTFFKVEEIYTNIEIEQKIKLRGEWEALVIKEIIRDTVYKYSIDTVSIIGHDTSGKSTTIKPIDNDLLPSEDIYNIDNEEDAYRKRVGLK